MIIKHNNKNIFVFSDTHGQHRDVIVPEGADIVICAGDAVEDDLNGDEYNDFIDWFSGLSAKWKIFIPGNHELSFAIDKSENIVKAMKGKDISVMQNSIMDCDGVTICSIGGDVSIADADIPTDIDILVTHYPPYGILDEGLGSPEILNFVMKSKPTYHLFGHIHATAGEELQFGETLCRNIGICK
jgi:Icc-related predicted phosphoesterase